MRKTALPFLIVLLSSLPISCSNRPDGWLKAVPHDAVVVQTAFDAKASVAYAELSLMAGADTSSLPEPAILGPRLLGRALVGHGVGHLSTLWVLEGDLRPALTEAGWQPVSVYDNSFGNLHVYRVGSTQWTLSVVGPWTLLCSQSAPVEDALRAYHDRTNALPPPNGSGSLIIHGGTLGKLGAHLAAPLYDNMVATSVRGLGSDHPTLETLGNGRDGFAATGSFPVTGELSPLARYLASEATDHSLEQRIPSEASLVFLYNDPVGRPEHDRVRWRGLNPSDADRLAPTAQALQEAVAPGIAFVALDGSGGETAFLRSVRSDDANAVLAELYAKGYIDGSNELFQSRSAYLARLLGSALCTYTAYYIGVGDGFLILSDKTSVARRLLGGTFPQGSLHDLEEYRTFRGGSPTGAVIWTHLPNLISSARLSAWLDPEVTLPSALPTYQWGGISTTASTDGRQLHYHAEFGQVNRRAPQQLALLWQFPLRGEDLTGPPLITVLNGKTAIVASRADGTLFAFQPDGTLLFEVTTGLQRPLGSAVAHDWYGNRSPVLFQAAGNAVYAWSPSGTLLPGFPFVLDSAISAPLLFTDADGDGESDLVVATADERLHLINRNGRGHLGWPVYTRGRVVEGPQADRSSGRWIVTVASGGVRERFNHSGISEGTSAYSAASDNPSAPFALADQWDLTGDGTPERIEMGGGVRILDGKTGAAVPAYATLSALLHAAVADMNGDGKPEILGVYNGQLRCYRLGRP